MSSSTWDSAYVPQRYEGSVGFDRYVKEQSNARIKSTLKKMVGVLGKRRKLAKGSFVGLSVHEKKFIDNSGSAQAMPAVGSVTEIIPDIATGTGETERIGRYIKVTNFIIRFDFYLANLANTSLGQDSLRVIIFIDTQTNGAAPGVTDLLESAHYQSFNNLANRKRFRVLTDKFISINSNGGAGDGSTNRTIGHSMMTQWVMKKAFPMEYSGTSGATSQRTQNNMYMLLMSSGDTRTTLTWRARTRFTDGN